MDNSQRKTIARKLPHSIDAEQAVLGCVLIGEEAPHEILNELKADDFYTDSHKEIFEAMHNLYLKSVSIDYVTLSDELEKQNKLEAIGGINYISTLTNIVPSAANYQHYVDIVKKSSTVRKLIMSSQGIIEKAYGTDDAADILAYAESEIFGVAEKNERSHLSPIQESLPEVMEKFNKLVKDPDALQGIPTGFVQLDYITNGLQKGDLIILAARPGFGKTSLAMNIVEHAALKENASCAVFSLEMPRVQLAQRALCSVAKVSMEKALRAKLEEKEWRRLFAAIKQFDNAKLYVDDSSMNTPADIKSKCLRIKREKGLDLVMIDYLQLMNSGKKMDSRQLEISDITRNLKIMAKELGVPVIVLSQLSRAVEQRQGGHKPVLSDLRESGAIEQDADIVFFIHRPENYSDTPEDKLEIGIAELIIAKHRNGRTGEVKLAWNGSTTTFSNLSSDSFRGSLDETAPVEKPNEKALDDAMAYYDDVPVDLNSIPPADDGYIPPTDDLAPPEDGFAPPSENENNDNNPKSLDDIDLSKIF